MSVGPRALVSRSLRRPGGSTGRGGSSGNNSWVGSSAADHAHPDPTFKTLYFPADRVRAGMARRVTISLPTVKSKRFALTRLATSVSSGDFRRLIGDCFLEDLEGIAQSEGRSLSNVCLRLFESGIETMRTRKSDQLQLPLSPGPVDRTKLNLGLTFQETKTLPVHGWYPYVEGFNAPYVERAISRDGQPSSVYDPFGGAGTTMLTASSLGLPSFYSEINPFMAFVANTKVNSAAWARSHLELTQEKFTEYLTRLDREMPKWARRADLSSYAEAFPERDFFEEEHLRDLLGARNLVEDVVGDHAQLADLLRLACAANAVHSSNMTRRADLRRRRSDEYKNRVVKVGHFVGESVRRMLADIAGLPPTMAPSHHVSDDCRALPPDMLSMIDLAITSPPYLNGTNYFRNTKIELWLLGFLKTEEQLSDYRARAIAAGINNVSRSRPEPRRFDFVEDVATKLDECAGDRRIPALVRHYFSDMDDVVRSVYRVLRPGGRFVLDIGDSQYYGVHVPTDTILERLGEGIGFSVPETTVLARRHSRDKSPLVQREIVFQKPGKRRSH